MNGYYVTSETGYEVFVGESHVHIASVSAFSDVERALKLQPLWNGVIVNGGQSAYMVCQ